MIALLKTLDRAVAVTCKTAAIACMLGIFVLLGAAILLRLMPLFTIAGYDEIIELLFIWMVMLTSLALWREGVLYRVVMLESLLPPAPRRLLEILINIAMFGFAMILVIYGVEFMQIAGETTPFLRLDKGWWYAAIPGCGALMAVYSLVWLYRVATGRGELHSTTSLVG
jgi:TRAP-type C4-dicarboxylate transport system permease small subunit